MLDKHAPRFELAAACIIKNEARYVPEWIAYHMARGIQYFLFYDNQSTDDLAHAIAPFVAQGIARVIPWPNFVIDPEIRRQAWHEQNAAYTHAARALAGVAEWLICIDMDEFVATVDDRPIPRHLGDLPGRDLLTLYWVNFGSSGHDSSQPGLVIETFVRCQASPDVWGWPFKFLARPEAIKLVESAHTAVVAQDNAVGASYAGARFYTGDEILANIDTTQIWINHYHVKSREEYAAKVRRGWAENTDDKNYDWQHFLKKYDTNDRHDARMARYGDSVRSIMDELHRAPPLVPPQPGAGDADLLVRIVLTATSDLVIVDGMAIDLRHPGRKMPVECCDIFNVARSSGVADQPTSLLGDARYGDCRYGFRLQHPRRLFPFGQIRLLIDGNLYVRSF